MNSFFTTYAILALVVRWKVVADQNTTHSVKHSSPTIAPSNSTFHKTSHISRTPVTVTNSLSVIISKHHSRATIGFSSATPATSEIVKSISVITPSRSDYYNISSTIFEYTSSIISTSSIIIFTTTPSDPTKLHYQFPENTSDPCIRFDGEVELQVVYNEKKVQEKISLYQGANVSGLCADPKNPKFFITLTSPKVIFTINFSQDNTSWYLTGFVVTLDKVNIPMSLKNDQLDLKFPRNHSYFCDTDENFPASTAGNYTVTVTLKNLKLQPFKANKTFDNALVCPAKDNSKKTSSVVPIAVGGALAGLIVIVLVAYLIGRRRGSRGYQKV